MCGLRTKEPFARRFGQAPPRTCGNLWLRAGRADPWEYDVILMDASPSLWTYKRDARISRPLDETLWLRDGVAYLRPEVQLLHKAPSLRPKDQTDFEACLPCSPTPTKHG
jgi:hypothetical protein